MAQRISKNTGRVFQPGKPLSMETRQHIISDLETHGGFKGNLALPRGLPTRVAQKYRVERNTIYNLWRRYCLDGDIRPRPRAHRQRIVSKEDIQYVQTFRTHKPDSQLKTIRENLLKRSSNLGNISISTVSRMVNHYSTLEEKKHANKQNYEVYPDENHLSRYLSSEEYDCDYNSQQWNYLPEIKKSFIKDNGKGNTCNVPLVSSRDWFNAKVKISAEIQGYQDGANGKDDEDGQQNARVLAPSDSDNTTLSQYAALWNIWQARNWSMMYPYLQSSSRDGGKETNETTDSSSKTNYFKPVYVDMGAAIPEQTEALDLSLPGA